MDPSKVLLVSFPSSHFQGLAQAPSKLPKLSLTRNVTTARRPPSVCHGPPSPPPLYQPSKRRNNTPPSRVFVFPLHCSTHLSNPHLHDLHRPRAIPIVPSTIHDIPAQQNHPPTLHPLHQQIRQRRTHARTHILRHPQRKKNKLKIRNPINRQKTRPVSHQPRRNQIHNIKPWTSRPTKTPPPKTRAPCPPQPAACAPPCTPRGPPSPQTPARVRHPADARPATRSARRRSRPRRNNNNKTAAVGDTSAAALGAGAGMSSAEGG